MAHIYGQAGEYPAGEAKAQSRKAAWTATMAMLFGGIAIGALITTAIFCSVIGIRLGASLALLLVAAGLFAAMRWGLARADRVLDEAIRRATDFYRGWQGEALVGHLLEDLDDDWHVFHGKKLESRRDLDHVAVGPTGLWCLSTKNTRGLFSLAPDGRVFHNNKTTRFISEARDQAMDLHDRLASQLGNDVPYVNATLAVPLAYVEFAGPKQNVWVLHKDDLVKTMKSRPVRLSKDQIERYAKALKLLFETASEIYRSAPIDLRDPARTH